MGHNCETSSKFCVAKMVFFPAVHEINIYIGIIHNIYFIANLKINTMTLGWSKSKLFQRNYD